MADPQVFTAQQAAVVAAVRAAVGARFRPQGRQVGTGLDCVGVALLAAAAAGRCVHVEPYVMGGDHAARIVPALTAIGCRPVACAEPGDLMLIAPTPRQRHLAVRTPLGVVHAHAGLRRVVEGPLDPGWVVLGSWRLPEGH
jgi:lipoprotein Spr